MISIIKKSSIVFLLLATECAASDNHREKQPTLYDTLEYTIHSEGDHIGIMTTYRKIITESQIEITRNVAIDTKFNIWTLKLNSQETLRFHKYSEDDKSQYMRITEVNRKISENGKTLRVSGERKNSGFWLNSGFVEDLTKSKSSEIINGSMALASTAVPYLGTLLTIFSDDEQEKKLFIEDSDYDACVEDIPHLIDRISQHPKLFKLLNTENLTLSDYTISLGKSGYHPIKGLTIPYQEIIAKNDKYQSHYFIATDDIGPYIVAAKGEDSDGRYNITLVNQSRKNHH